MSATDAVTSAGASPARPSTPLSRRISLVGVLALLLLAEMLTARIGQRLGGELMLPRGLQTAMAHAGNFTFHAASLLSVLLAALAVIRLLSQPMLLPTGWGPGQLIARATSVVSMVGFVFIAVLGVWLPLPATLRLYLVLLFVLIVGQLVRGSWPATVARGRVRVWLGMCVVAVVAHFAWMLLTHLAHGERSQLAHVLLKIGEATAATAGAAAPFCLLTKRSPLRGPLVVGVVLTAALTMLAMRDWLLAAKLAAYSMGLQIPTPIAGVALEAIALGSWATATLALLAEKGTPRLRGWGLALIGLSGYQLELPYQVCSTMLGVLCIVESYLRERAVVVPPELWRRIVTRMARVVGTTEVSVVGAPGFEEAHINGTLDGEAAEAIVERRAWNLARVELAIGHAPAEEAPPLSLQRRGMPRLGRRDGLEVATGDLDFDACFIAFDARRLDAADPVLDDERRPRLRRLVDGWLGVWPGSGARLRSTGAETFTVLLDESERGDEAVADLLSLLVEVKRRG